MARYMSKMLKALKMITFRGKSGLRGEEARGPGARMEQGEG
jgi:hypothetical protein